MFPESQNQSMICSILNGVVTRESIMEFEKALKEMPQISTPPLVHEFAEGLYIRTIFMSAAPDGMATLITGKIHKHECLNIVSQGRCMVSTEFGQEEVSSGSRWVSQAGSKRALVVLEDCIWTTVHANPDNLRDIAELERMIACDTYEELDQYHKMISFEVMP